MPTTGKNYYGVIIKGLSTKVLWPQSETLPPAGGRVFLSVVKAVVHADKLFPPLPSQLTNARRVRTLSIDPAAAEVTVLTQGVGEISIQIWDGDRIIAEAAGWSDGKAVFTCPIPDARLWSVEHPHLYTCKAAFGADSCETGFGVRSWTWGPHGLPLNGKRIILRGGVHPPRQRRAGEAAVVVCQNGGR